MPEVTNTPTVAEIVANPEAYGFAWYLDKVQKDGTVLDNVPLVKHLDVDKLRATFGDRFFLESADGTSRHVTNQRIVRDARYDDRKITVDALKTMIVENMLGQKSPRRRTVITERVFIGLDGKEYKTETEAQAASLAWMVDQKLNA